MITYDKSWWGNKVLFRAYGSAFPRSLPYACVAALIAATLSALFDTTGWELFSNAYPVQMFFFVVGFMVIFRNNLSYGRYWEGRSKLQDITANLSDAVRTAINFDRNAVPKEKPTPEQTEQHEWFCDTFVHLISLFHGVALATLRGDYDMENLVVHDSLANAPPTNARLLNKKVRKPFVNDADKAAESEDGGKAGDTSSPLDDASESSHGPAKSSKQSHGWAGAKDILDYFVLRTNPERAKHIHSSMKLPIIGDLTLAEGVALGAFTTSGDTCEAVPDLDLGIHGIMLENGTYAPAPTERVHTIASWIHQCIIERIEAGGIKASGPLQARIYATLGNAFVAFEHCQKLTDTPFPFPWVQAVNIALLLFTLLAPLAVVGFIENAFMATALTFMAVATHVTLNEVASDIEDPFHYDPNELPLPQMQYKLNERLLAVLYSERPLAFTDVGGLTGPGNTVAVPGADAAAGAPDDGTAAAKNAPGGNMFASIAQAAFVAAGGESVEGTPLRRGFMGRSAGAALSQPDMAGLMSFSTSRARPGVNTGHRWGRNAAQAGGLAGAAMQAMARGGAAAPPAADPAPSAAAPPVAAAAGPAGATPTGVGAVGVNAGAAPRPRRSMQDAPSARVASMWQTRAARAVNAQRKGLLPASMEAPASRPAVGAHGAPSARAARLWQLRVERVLDAKRKGLLPAGTGAPAAARATPSRRVASRWQATAARALDAQRQGLFPPTAPAPSGPSANVLDAPSPRVAGKWQARAARAVNAQRSGRGAPPLAPIDSTQHGLLEVIAETGSPTHPGAAQ